MRYLVHLTLCRWLPEFLLHFAPVDGAVGGKNKKMKVCYYHSTNNLHQGFFAFLAMAVIQPSLSAGKQGAEHAIKV